MVPFLLAVVLGDKLLIAVGVAASRVLLDVHWLTDVLGGLALGWAWFAVCSVAFGGRLLRFGAGAEATRASPPRVGHPRSFRRRTAGRPVSDGGCGHH